MPRASAIGIVGMKAGGRAHVVEFIAYHDPCLAVPEPDNAYDPNAIAVYTAPRATLRHPVTSSVADYRGHGVLHEEDRELLMDRQVGYVPAAVAARLELPGQGIVGWVGAVRYHPETGYPSGFDMVAAWPALLPRQKAKPTGYDPDAHRRRSTIDPGYGLGYYD